MKSFRQIFKSEAFSQSAPTLLIAFINKLGTIGISLIPILLVNRKYSTADSTMAMTWIRGVMPVAILFSGWITDRIGLRAGVLWALFCTTVGLTGIPLSHTVYVLIAFGIISQIGDAMCRVSFRLLITQTVSLKFQKEALGWTRMVNNLGQVVSFTLGLLASKFGVVPLFLFDAFTSAMALVFGLKILPTEKQGKPAENLPPSDPIHPPLEAQSFKHRLRFLWAPLLGCTVVLFFWVLLYDLFMSGVAGRLEVLQPGDGLRLFSIMMIINTVLCTVFSVKATQWLKSPNKVFLGSIFLTAAGLWLGFAKTEVRLLLFVSTLLVTTGEIGLGALGAFTQIRLLPQSKNAGLTFSSMQVLNLSGRVLAASLVFPWVVHPTSSIPVIGTCVVAVVLTAIIVFVFRKRFSQVTA